MGLFRGFISVDITDIGELVKVERELRTVGGGMRPVSMDIVHVTLKFLGETDEAAVPKIIEAMEKAAKGVTPFDIELKGMGSFQGKHPGGLGGNAGGGTVDRYRQDPG